VSSARSDTCCLDRDQARQKVVVPPNDVQRFYNDNIQQYQTPEQVRASHILLETAGKNDADVKKRAEEILKQVKGGADFAELAKKVSEDKGSKDNGGDLDYFGRGRMVPEFENRGLRDAARSDQRSREIAVRLPHHQGRR
jgi:parvulin-like peptidyl-prolyl isomerase